MYSLVVTFGDEWVDRSAIAVPSSRFLEYTGQVTYKQLVTLSTEAIASIRSWPCLLMQEGRGQEQAFLGRVSNVRETREEVVASVDLLSTQPVLTNDGLWRLRDQLGIEQFEFTRTHWAVKDVDLLGILSRAGFQLPELGLVEQPLPMPPRPLMLQARDVVSQWGHTEIDDLLLDAGVEGLEVGRPVGSRRDRANEILRFALDNPGATTAENALLSAYLVKRAGLDRQTGADSPVLAVDTPSTPPPPRTESPPQPNRVFVVHGQDDAVRDSVVSFLSGLSLHPIVLHEQPNMGRHLLTKFVEEAELATFAVILMTADDIGGRDENVLSPRARQNVILELGYFLAHLGQPRVCALKTPGLETPSDFDGIVYIAIDANGHWKVELQRELVAAGLPVQA